MLLVAFAVAALAGPAAAPPDDLVALERLIAAAHPAPHRYTSAEALRAAFTEERARLAQGEVSELDAGRAVQRVLALLGDAHVAVGLPMMQPGSETAVSLVPVLPRRVGGQVLLDASLLDLPPGTALSAIDGVPIDAIYDALLPLVPADGRDAEAALRSLEAHFPKFYALQHGMLDTYRLDLRLPDGEAASREAPGADRVGARAMSEARHVSAWWGAPTPDRLPALARVDGVAVLGIPSFGAPDLDAFRARVDASFQQLSPDEPLVIDLRGNEGGLRPNAFAVLDHLLGAPYVEWLGMRVARTRVPRRLRRGLVWPFSSDRERLGAGFQRSPNGGWQADGDPLAHWARPSATPHQGPVALLVDGRTGSAANGLVLVAKGERADVVVVGERLGGACDRHVGELPVVWTGPVTGVVVMFSLIDIAHVEVAGCEPGRGLAPDVPVAPTIEDFVQGLDPWLRAAVERLTAQAPPG